MRQDSFGEEDVNIVLKSWLGVEEVNVHEANEWMEGKFWVLFLFDTTCMGRKKQAKALFALTSCLSKG